MTQQGSIKTIGTILKELRLISGFTLRQVEEITSISNAYLSQLENDKIKKPSINFLNRLSEVYNVELNFLLVNAGFINKSNQEPKKNALCDIEITDEEARKMIEYLKFLRYQNKKP